MRVAQFSYEYPPQSTGGLGTYLEGLLSYQEEQGDDVDLFYLGDTGVPAGAVHLPSFAGDGIVTYGRDELMARNGGRAYDVVVCQDWPGVVAAQALWKNGVPLVYTCHLPLDWDIGEYDDIPCAYGPQMEFSGFAHADLIITVSRAVEDYLHRRFPFTRGRTRVVHNGTDPRFFHPGADGATVRDPELILYAGRFYEQKGFDLLPDIFARVKAERPAARLEIIGTGELAGPVRGKLEALGLAGDVTWHEFAALPVVRDLYRAASVVLMPSRLEPFGLVAVEAMATGAPLVAADTGGLGEIVVHGETGLLVAPDDTKGFADAVTRLLDDPALRAAVATAARTAVAERFDQRTCFARTREAYASVLPRHR